MRLPQATRLEAFVEAKNLFNRTNVRSVNSVAPTTALGDPLAPIPGDVCEVGAANTSSCFPVTNVFQERQVQVGFKFIF